MGIISLIDSIDFFFFFTSSKNLVESMVPNGPFKQDMFLSLLDTFGVL